MLPQRWCLVRSTSRRAASSTLLFPGARYCSIFKAEILIPEKHFLFYQPSILASVGLNSEPKKPSENYTQDVPGCHQDAIVTPLISPGSSVLDSLRSSLARNRNTGLCLHCQESQPYTQENCKEQSSRLRLISLLQELFIHWLVALSKLKHLGCQQSSGSGVQAALQVVRAWHRSPQPGAANTILDLQRSSLLHIPPSLHGKPPLNLTCS